MEVTSFLYCNGYTQVDGMPALLGPLQFLNPAFIPGQYSFVVSFGLFHLPDSGEITLEYKFVSPTGKTVHNISSVALPIAKEEKEKKCVGMQVNMDLKNIVLEMEGTYKSILYINGEKVGEYPIAVVKK